MNVKYEAFKRTLILVMISAIVSAIAITLINVVPTNIMIGLITVGVFGWMFYIFYSIVLGQVESEVRLKEIKEKLDNK